MSLPALLMHKNVGILENILVYPLDGGKGFYCNKGYCFKEGLQAVRGQPNIALIAYSSRTKEAILNVHCPELGTQFCDSLVTEAYLSWNNNSAVNELTIYFGKPIIVQDLGDDVAAMAHTTYGCSSLELRIAFCSAANRQRIFSDGLPICSNIVDNLSPYFSPYTLIGNNSLDRLYNITGLRTRPDRFRASLVITQLEPNFSEYTNIHSVKIGQNTFNNVRPSTQSPQNFLSQFTPYPEKLEPYNTLKRLNTLKNLYPQLFPQYDKPTFGINMELNSDIGCEIAVGDKVTIFWNTANFTKKLQLEA